MGQIKNIKLHIVTDIKTLTTKDHMMTFSPKPLWMYLTFLLSVLFIIQEIKANGVQVEIRSKPPGCPQVAKAGDFISINYRGNIYDPTTGQIGEEFDSSYSRGKTFDFRLGMGQAIKGWDEGIPGMCVGEKRKLTVPPELAYGDRGYRDQKSYIAPGATLVFEIELVKIN